MPANKQMEGRKGSIKKGILGWQRREKRLQGQSIN